MTNRDTMTLGHLRAARHQLALALMTEHDDGRACWIEQQIQCTESMIWGYGVDD